MYYMFTYDESSIYGGDTHRYSSRRALEKAIRDWNKSHFPNQNAVELSQEQYDGIQQQINHELSYED